MGRHLVDQGLLCPHSLRLADFTGDGRLDVFVDEVGLEGNESPTHGVSLYRGDGEFSYP